MVNYYKHSGISKNSHLFHHEKIYLNSTQSLFIFLCYLQMINDYSSNNSKEYFSIQFKEIIFQ